VRLQSFVSSPPRALGNPPVVLLHGWEGSAESLYVLSLAQLLFARHVEVVRLNLRDHGATHHLNRELFHSCRLPEVIGAVAALQRHFAQPHTAAFMRDLGGLLSGPADVVFHTTASARRLDPQRGLVPLD